MIIMLSFLGLVGIFFYCIYEITMYSAEAFELNIDEIMDELNTRRK